jgi:hypothetical protein
MTVTGNAATNPPAGKPPRFRRWNGWLYRLIGRVHPSRRQRIRAYAHAGLTYHGRMVYTEGPGRSELFSRPRGKFLEAHADCSQYAATCAHWSGVAKVDNQDWTGTLAEKGAAVPEAKVKPGHFVFFGAPPYVHMGVMGTRRHVVGFGSQAGPDRNTLATLVAYFAGIGHPGVAFRDVTRA